jgi:hypothetical protein
MEFFYCGEIKGDMTISIEAKNKEEAKQKILTGDFTNTDLTEWEFVEKIELKDIGEDFEDDV